MKNDSVVDCKNGKSLDIIYLNEQKTYHFDVKGKFKKPKK
jgi:hypothetical protein